MPDEKIAPLPGQGVNTAEAAAQAQAAGTEPEAPFFEYQLPTGEKETYRTRDSLTQAHRDSYLRRADYTRKTQEVAEMRKAIEEEKKKFAEEQKAFLQAKQRYDGYDQKLKERPDLQRRLEEAFSQPMEPAAAFEKAQGYVDEKTQTLLERLDALEKQNQEATTKHEIDEAFSELKGKYPDVDETAIMETLEAIADGKIAPMIEQLYWAHKGRMTPAAMEQKIVDGLKKKEGAALVPPSPSGKGVPPKFKSTKDAREAAFEEAGISG